MRRSVMSVNDTTVADGSFPSSVSARALRDSQTRLPSGRRARTIRPCCALPVVRVMADGNSEGGMGWPVSSCSSVIEDSLPITSRARMPRIRSAAGLTDSTRPVAPTTSTPSPMALTTAVKWCSARLRAVSSAQISTYPSSALATDTRTDSSSPSDLWCTACATPPASRMATGSSGAPTTSLMGRPIASSARWP